MYRKKKELRRRRRAPEARLSGKLLPSPYLHTASAPFQYCITIPHHLTPPHSTFTLLFHTTKPRYCVTLPHIYIHTASAQYYLILLCHTKQYPILAKCTLPHTISYYIYIILYTILYYTILLYYTTLLYKYSSFGPLPLSVSLYYHAPQHKLHLSKAPHNISHGSRVGNHQTGCTDTQHTA